MTADTSNSSKNPQATRASLLLRLRDAQNAEAWEQFVTIYTPLIYWFCCRQGLQEADAADVCQEVMRAVVRAMETFEYDPRRGKFRNWLLTVVRSKIHNLRASRQRHPEPSGQTAIRTLLDQQAAPAEESDWDIEYYRCIFQWAANRIRPSFHEATWQAFWRMTVEQEEGQKVAESLGLSLGAVYVAKSRVLARLRQEMETVDQEELTGSWT